jgi:pilus assembly protein Flp/PilA
MNRLKLMHSFCGFVRYDSGATAIEYALIAAGIATAIIAVVMSLGTSLQSKYQAVSDAL